MSRKMRSGCSRSRLFYSEETLLKGKLIIMSAVAAESTATQFAGTVCNSSCHSFDDSRVQSALTDGCRNLSLSTILKLGRGKRQRDPLDYGPATLGMLLKGAVVKDFLEDQPELSSVRPYLTPICSHPVDSIVSAGNAQDGNRPRSTVPPSPAIRDFCLAEDSPAHLVSTRTESFLRQTTFSP